MDIRAFRITFTMSGETALAIKQNGQFFLDCESVKDLGLEAKTRAKGIAGKNASKQDLQDLVKPKPLYHEDTLPDSRRVMCSALSEPEERGFWLYFNGD